MDVAFPEWFYYEYNGEGEFTRGTENKYAWHLPGKCQAWRLAKSKMHEREIKKTAQHVRGRPAYFGTFNNTTTAPARKKMLAAQAVSRGLTSPL